MDAPSKTNLELIFSIACIGFGILVACFLSPKDRYFLGNMAIFWLPQAAILLCMWLLGSRPSVISGVALILSLYLAAFGVFTFYNSGPDASMAWLGYLFSLPGAGIGALIGIAIIKLRKIHAAAVAGVVSAICTFVGLAINQAALCNTVLYCGL
ncbi:hypothetical protein LRS11_20725 [Pseudomonas sp. J452]|uniref:hypothetical protein n=1 Tax=Pseudomonas sp. J452 TaxID=2898441 RepID=UPI0021ADEA86|nr:hypothetical protein [Pseudomonas sp. J452]UUY08193.1 hypothetical protein LRS11_20725 [Pseudomonas sp. J452]